MIFFVLLVLFDGQVPSAADAPIPMFLSKELPGVHTPSDVAGAVSRPFDTMWRVRLLAGGTRQITTCKDFIGVTKSRFELENAVDWPEWWQQGAPCFALDALERAKPALRTYLGWFRLSKAGIAKLPARLALLESPDDQDDVAAAEKACRGWGRFDQALKVRIESVDRAALRSDGWTGHLVLYARADLDRDGIEDLLFRRDGHVIGGTAADSRVFVVTQTSTADCPRVVRVMGAPDESEAP